MIKRFDNRCDDILYICVVNQKPGRFIHFTIYFDIDTVTMSMQVKAGMRLGKVIESVARFKNDIVSLSCASTASVLNKPELDSCSRSAALKTR